MTKNFPISQSKSAVPEAEARAVKILHERLWHFTSVGLGNCRAAQRVRREIEHHQNHCGTGVSSTLRSSPATEDGPVSSSIRSVARPPPSPLANHTLEQLIAGLSHLEAVGLANSRAAELNRRELQRRIALNSQLATLNYSRLANDDFDSNEPRDKDGQWTKEGDAGGSATKNPTQTVPPTPEEIRRAAQTMPWEQFHGTEADYIASHPNDPVYSALRAANDPVPGPPSIRAFTPWEKFTFDLRQLMFKWFPGTRPSGQPSPGQVLGAAAMLLPIGIGPETRLGKLLLGYFTAKTAAEQPEYYRAIKQELQTGNYSDAGRHAVEDALKIAMIGAGIHEGIAGEGPNGPAIGKSPAEPGAPGGAPEGTRPDLPETDQQQKDKQSEAGQNNQSAERAETTRTPSAESATEQGPNPPKEPTDTKTSETATKAPIKEGDVTTYQDFRDRSVKGDDVQGHELWQHANIKAHGLATERFSTDASRQNPVIALDGKTHNQVNIAQRSINPYSQTPAQNITANAEILRNIGAADDTTIDRAEKMSKEHSEKYKKP